MWLTSITYPYSVWSSENHRVNSDHRAKSKTFLVWPKNKEQPKNRFYKFVCECVYVCVMGINIVDIVTF